MTEARALGKKKPKNLFVHVRVGWGVGYCGYFSGRLRVKLESKKRYSVSLEDPARLKTTAATVLLVRSSVTRSTSGEVGQELGRL